MKRPAGELHTEQMILRLTPGEAAHLERMRIAGGYPSKASLARSLILEILRDDLREHQEASA